MARKDARTDGQKIKDLQAELYEKERELKDFRGELAAINKQLEKFIMQLSTQVKLASMIQRALVPTENPKIPGFEFSSKFVASGKAGADYFDIFELQDKYRFGLLMASSTGHGMASLFLNVLLKLTAEIEAKRGMAPENVLAHMLKELEENIPGDDAVAVFYAIVSRKDYTLTYSRAGEIPALLYKYEHDKLVRLDQTQPALKKKSKGGFRSETVPLDCRDRLIVVSEGLTKAANKSDEEFGEKRLEEAVLEHKGSTIHELRNEILFQVKKFVGDAEIPKDLSAMVMGVKDKVVKLQKI